MHWSNPAAWVVAGLILFGLEALHPAMILMFFGLGAILTGLAAWMFPLNLEWQIIFFALASVAALAGLRRGLKKVFKGNSSASQAKLARLRSLIGESGLVSETLTPGSSGRIKLRGSFYSAFADTTLAVGQNVTVTEDPRGDQTLLKVAPKS